MNVYFSDQRWVKILSFLGLLPLILGMLLLWLVSAEYVELFLNLQLVYSIATLSFLGGMHWAAVLLSDNLSVSQTKKILLWSSGLMAASVLSTMMGGFRFAMLMLGFIAAYQVDKRAFVWYGLPSWFLKVRFICTLVVVITLLLTVMAGNHVGG